MIGTITQHPKLRYPSLHDFHGTFFDKAAHFHHWTLVIGLAVGAVFTFAMLKAFAEDRVRKGSENSTAGLNYVVGPMGSGKSMFGVRTIIEALVRGQYAITNVRLLPGWAELVVKKKWPREARDPERLRAAIDRLQGFYVYETSLRTAMRYRLPCVRCGGNTRECGHVGPDQEGRAVFVWDETHNDLNNRDFEGSGSDEKILFKGKRMTERQADKERRRMTIRWATQLRKLGFSGYLLSQHHENTDAQLRRVCNHIIRLQNQRNSEGGWIAKLLPKRWTLFLVYWYPSHLASSTPEHMIQPIRRERYWLPWTRHLYDSWDTFHDIDALDDEDSPVLLSPNGIAILLNAGDRNVSDWPNSEGDGTSAEAGGPGIAGGGPAPSPLLPTLTPSPSTSWEV